MGEELAVSVVSRSLAVNPQELVDDPDRWPKGQMPVRDVRQVAAKPPFPYPADARFKAHGAFYR